MALQIFNSQETQTKSSGASLQACQRPPMTQATNAIQSHERTVPDFSVAARERQQLEEFMRALSGGVANSRKAGAHRPHCGEAPGSRTERNDCSPVLPKLRAKGSQDDKTTGGCIFNLATGSVSCFRNQESKEQPAFDLKTSRGSEKVPISRLTHSSFTRQALTSPPFERAFESLPSS
jgi:hypothetical protein